MKKIRVTLVSGLVICGGVLLGLGSAPRYIEELRIGGGYGEPVDGGTDFDRSGNMLADGDVTCRILRANNGVFGDKASAPAARLHLRTGTSGFSGTRDTRLTDGLLVETSLDAVVELQGGAGRSTEVWFGDPDSESAGRIQYNHATDAVSIFTAGASKATLDATGKWTCTGSIASAGGEVAAGVANSVRGIVLANGGTGNNAPGVVRLVSPGGLSYYLFVADDGTLRAGLSLPTGNSSGASVGAQLDPVIGVLTANDTTPSVSGGSVFKIPDTWTSGHNITMFDNGVVSQQIVLIGGDNDCVVTDGGHMRLAGDWTGAPGKALSLVFDGTDWFEKSRADT